MERATVMLMLAVGSFIFGLLLVTLKYSNSQPQEVPYWIIGSFLRLLVLSCCTAV